MWKHPIWASGKIVSDSLCGCLALLIFAPASISQAHPLSPSLLELHEESGGVFSVRWKTPSSGAPGVELEPILPETCHAIEERTAQAGANYIEIRWRVRCGEDGVAGAVLAVAGLDRSRTSALIRVRFEDGTLAKGLVRADAPEFRVVVGDGVARNYLSLGFEHILRGPDHLLFVLGLLLLITVARKLAGAVTSFTLGHSLTLGLAVMGLIRIPQQIIEVGVALSLVMVALELVRRDRTTVSLLRSHPGLAAFGFGLLHGLGFAGALREAGLPADEIPFALLFFNIGIEAGQLAFIVVMVGLLMLLEGMRVQRTRLEQGAAYAIGSLAVFWVIERSAGLF